MEKWWPMSHYKTHGVSRICITVVDDKRRWLTFLIWRLASFTTLKPILWSKMRPLTSTELQAKTHSRHAMMIANTTLTSTVNHIGRFDIGRRDTVDCRCRPALVASTPRWRRRRWPTDTAVPTWLRWRRPRGRWTSARRPSRTRHLRRRPAARRTHRRPTQTPSRRRYPTAGARLR